MTPFLFCVAVLLPILLVGIWLGIRSLAAFEERYPPITDAEFLALCKPGTNPEVALKVRRIVAEYFAIEYERVYPSMSFIEDIGAD